MCGNGTEATVLAHTSRFRKLTATERCETEMSWRSRVLRCGCRVHSGTQSSDHLCYLSETATRGEQTGMLFSGDHVLGGTTTAIIPLDGDLAAYPGKPGATRWRWGASITAIAPGHGAVITDPGATMQAYLDRRHLR